jgi:hypothetical protein
MAISLRELYKVLSCFSTATQAEMCNDLLRQLTAKSKRKAKGDDNLAGYFANAIEASKTFCQIERPFIPGTRGNQAGRNPVANVMAKAPRLKVTTSSEKTYDFTFLQRELPHLRAMTKKEQKDFGWIDYVGRTTLRPILGEIKWKGDKNTFYAFVQLLTYLSEMATPNQIERSVRHDLFGKDIPAITTFDLHIFLANFNDRGEKGKLIELTRELASAFKERLQKDYPKTATCLGNVFCISGHIEDGSDCFSEVRSLWMV